MIILKSILTTFKSSIIFKCSWGSSVNWFEPKVSLPKSVKHSVGKSSVLVIFMSFLPAILATTFWAT